MKKGDKVKIKVSPKQYTINKIDKSTMELQYGGYKLVGVPTRYVRDLYESK